MTGRITAATLLEGVPVWVAPARGVCTYCATPSLLNRLALTSPPPVGCRICGGPLERLSCVPGVACDPGHDDCPGCGKTPAGCIVCLGAGTAHRACVYCHGTGRTLTDHCCGCGGTNVCVCPVTADTR